MARVLKYSTLHFHISLERLTEVEGGKRDKENSLEANWA
jgi:hypothetical protein